MGLWYENQAYTGSRPGVEMQITFQLFGKELYQLDTHRGAFADKSVLRKTLAVIDDLQTDVLVFELMQADGDAPFMITGEGVFDGIGDGFIDDQAQRHSVRDVEAYFSHVHDKADLFRL